MFEDEINVHEVLLSELTKAGFISESVVKRYNASVMLKESVVENDANRYVVQGSLVIHWEMFKRVYFDYERYPSMTSMWTELGAPPEFWRSRGVTEDTVRKTFSRMVTHFRKYNREAQEITKQYGKFPSLVDRKRLHRDKISSNKTDDGDVGMTIDIDGISAGQRGQRKKSSGVVDMLNNKSVVPGIFYNDISRIPKHRHAGWLRIWEKIIHGINPARLFGRQWKKVFIMGYQFGKSSIIEIWYNSATSSFSVHDFNGVELGKPTATLQEATRLFVTFLLKEYESDVEIFKGNKNALARSYMDAIKRGAAMDAIEADREAKLLAAEKKTANLSHEDKIDVAMTNARRHQEYKRAQRDQNIQQATSKRTANARDSILGGTAEQRDTENKARRSAQDAFNTVFGRSGKNKNPDDQHSQYGWDDVTGDPRYSKAFDRRDRNRRTYQGQTDDVRYSDDYSTRSQRLNDKRSGASSGDSSFGPFPQLPLLPSPVIVPENKSMIYTMDGLNDYERDQIFKLAQAHYAALEKAEKAKLEVEKEKREIKELTKKENDLGPVGKATVKRKKDFLSQKEMEAQKAEAEVVEMKSYLDAISRRRDELKRLERNNMRKLSQRKLKIAAMVDGSKKNDKGPLKEGIEDFITDDDDREYVDLATRELDQEAVARRNMAEKSGFTTSAIRTSVVEGQISTYNETRSRSVTRRDYFSKLLFGNAKWTRMLRWGREDAPQLPTTGKTWYDRMKMVYHGVSFRADFVIGFSFRDEINIEVWYITEPDPTSKEGKGMISSYYVYDVTAEKIVRANLPYYRNAISVVLAKIGLT